MLNNTIRNIEEKDCFGCGACFNKCPHSAISMKYNDEGFIFPVVNEEKCVDCGICLKLCPALSPSIKNQGEPKCYAVWADDEIRKISSSGGMFTLLADYILSQGGSVCGASYANGYNKVEHVLISSQEDLPPLRESKYVQSDTKNVYRLIENILKENQYVLFCGCPCQVAGLYAYLGKDYHKLYTADLVCHGANSLKAYQSYLLDRAQGRSIEKVNFREKDVYGWSTPAVIHFTDGSVSREPASTSIWYKGFLNGIINRKCCDHCPYATIPRMGDITLADFWQVGKYQKEWDDKKGTSLVLINNSKGMRIFDSIKDRMILCKEAPLDYARRYNGQLNSPQKSHVNRQRFFKELDNKGYSGALDCAQKDLYDIGIMGWWYNANYGGVATYYALHQLLISMGYSVMMIDNPIKTGNAFRSPIDTMPMRFANRYYRISKRYPEFELRALNQHCKTFIVGSDQMWNYWLQKYSGPSFYLEYATDDKKKISYASSFGNRYDVPEAWRMMTSYYIQRFDFVSVREDYAVDICKETYGVDAEWVMDPVFLCEVEEYNKAAELSTVSEDKEYLFCYILNPTAEKRQIIEYVANEKGLEYIIVLDAALGAFDSNKEKMAMPNIKENVEEEDWLYYMKNSSFVITDSFHGACFSIIFKKPFICIANFERGIERFISMLSLYNLENHIVYKLNDVIDNLDLLDEINYGPVYQVIEIEKQKSIEWLKTAIESPKLKRPSSYDLLSRKHYELLQKTERLNSEYNKVMDFTNQLNDKVEFLKNELEQERINNQTAKSKMIKNRLKKFIK